MSMQKFAIGFTASLMFPLMATATPATIVSDGVSLREALQNGASKIVIKRRTGTIEINETLEYAGSTPLSIKGNGAEIVDAGIPDGDPILYISKGADLSISRLALTGPGGYSIENQGGGKGIYVEVPETREGVVSVKLSRVRVSDTGNHGVHISDCSLGDDCGGGQGGGGDGSAASVRVVARSVVIDGVGFGKQDADGIRVDDRGPGDIMFSATNSTFMNVGADGIELDEGNEGSVQVSARNLTFDSNGAYCVPFDDNPLLDPDCDDDGEADVDDAFDIDEAGPGGIFGMLARLTIVDNFDEGLDFDSEGEGDDNFIDLDIARVKASGNADEAIKVSEEGNASVTVSMRAIKVEGDVEVEEENDGDLSVSIFRSWIGDDLKLSEEDEGEGTARLRGTTVVDEKDFNNVEEI